MEIYPSWDNQKRSTIKLCLSPWREIPILNIKSKLNVAGGLPCQAHFLCVLSHSQLWDSVPEMLYFDN